MSNFGLAKALMKSKNITFAQNGEGAEKNLYKMLTGGGQTYNHTMKADSKAGSVKSVAGYLSGLSNGTGGKK